MYRVYISGPMTGHPDLNRTAFAMKEHELVLAGYTPVNPHDIDRKFPPSYIPTYEENMIECIKLLLTCDRIVMLGGWMESKGACLEKHIANVVGIGEIGHYD